MTSSIEPVSKHKDEEVDIRLPANLEIGPVLGRGARSMGYSAKLDGRDVAVKIYRPKFVEKFRRKYGLEIAQFEFDRNAAFRAVPGLKEFSAEPLMVLDENDGYSPAFVQSIARGTPLNIKIRELGYLPPRILELGRQIIDKANAAGLHDLDMSDPNIMVYEENGEWNITIYDFNLMPQYLFAPNPFVSLFYKLGLRKKSGRDYACLDHWVFLGEKAGTPPGSPSPK